MLRKCYSPFHSTFGQNWPRRQSCPNNQIESLNGTDLIGNWGLAMHLSRVFEKPFNILGILLRWILFWPEAFKLWFAGLNTVLTKLSFGDIWALFRIAIRKPSAGRTYKDKQAIIKISVVQAFKVVVGALWAVFAYSALASWQFAFLLAAVTVVLLDLVFWDAGSESSLRKEIKMREAEFGLSEADLRPLQIMEDEMRSVEPLTDEESDLFEIELANEAHKLGVSVEAYVKQYWVSRTGIKKPSPDTDATHQALREYLAGDD